MTRALLYAVAAVSAGTVVGGTWPVCIVALAVLVCCLYLLTPAGCAAERGGA